MREGREAIPMEDMFIQTDEQRAILQSVQRFVEDVVKPKAPALDALTDPAAGYCDDIVAAADAVGIRTMTLSEKYGGLGTDSLTTAMVVEELARGDLGISVVMAQTLKLAQIMEKALNEEQQKRSLALFAKDPKAVLAIGITEPDNASNYFLPYPTPMRTAGEKTKGGWVVNGMKHFISNGNRASFYPEENLVGEVGRGFDVLARFFPSSNSYAAAASSALRSRCTRRRSSGPSC